jgi:hypothetical protein
MARSFNGSSQYYTCGSFILDKPFSAHGWVNPTNITSYRPLFGTTSISSNPEFRVNQSTGTLSLLKQGVANIATSTGTVSAAVWTAIGVSYDSSGNWAFYINGTLDSSGTNLQTFGTGGTDTLTIGAAAQVVDWFLGSIADVATWNVILTAIEFAALRRGIRPFYVRKPALTLWLPLDGLATTEPDLSGGKNNGTATAGPISSTFGPPFTTFTPRWLRLDPVSIPPAFILMPQIVT